MRCQEGARNSGRRCRGNSIAVWKVGARESRDGCVKAFLVDSMPRLALVSCVFLAKVLRNCVCSVKQGWLYQSVPCGQHATFGPCQLSVSYGERFSDLCLQSEYWSQSKVCASCMYRLTPACSHAVLVDREEYRAYCILPKPLLTVISSLSAGSFVPIACLKHKKATHMDIRNRKCMHEGCRYVCILSMRENLQISSFGDTFCCRVI